jgi:hypothetical protein
MNEDLKKKLKKIDKAIERVMTIKVYFFLVVGMALYLFLIKDYLAGVLCCILLYLVVKMKNKYKNYLLEGDKLTEK